MHKSNLKRTSEGDRRRFVQSKLKSFLTCGFLQIKSCRWRCFDLLAHYTIFLPEFVKFRRTRGFAEFYKFFSRTDTSVIIYPKKSNLSILATLFPNSGFSARPCTVACQKKRKTNSPFRKI